jgi:hypothetical protein
MIAQVDEYKKLINHRLDENVKSFKLLFEMKHYGNCISIMRQELDQIMKLLFLLNRNKVERKQFMESSIESHKWFVLNKENRKEYITEEDIAKYSESLSGWDKSIYEFGLAFGHLTNSFNYGSKDPIKSMNDIYRKMLYDYIKGYHDKDYPKDFSLDDLIPILPMIFDSISFHLQSYMKEL